MPSILPDASMVENREADFYGTPLAAFERLLPYLPVHSDYWEPCAGDGRIVVWLRAAGFTAAGADLFAQNKLVVHGLDFLRDETQHDFIITNPPFSLAQEFITHALKHSRECLMLLRLNFLGAKKRRTWWRDGHTPNALFVLSDRPDFTGAGGDACEYAWFYWGRRWSGWHWL